MKSPLKVQKEIHKKRDKRNKSSTNNIVKQHHYKLEHKKTIFLQILPGKDIAKIYFKWVFIKMRVWIKVLRLCKCKLFSVIMYKQKLWCLI